jgi:CheY-like chemotaxis protein
LVAKILVVDDEPDARFLMRHAFEQAGHEVIEAHNGEAAIRAVYKSPPALVVTDMMMPVMGGAELIRRLRNAPITADIPILCVSGNPELAQDADLTLNKFGDLSDLVAIAEVLIAEGRGAR